MHPTLVFFETQIKSFDFGQTRSNPREILKNALTRFSIYKIKIFIKGFALQTSF